MNKSIVIGWDVGGAHLKAAAIDAQGQVQQVLQIPCALWKGLHLLEEAIDTALATCLLNQNNCTEIMHAVTMTGELVDLFDHRREGVLEISRVMVKKLSGKVYFYRACQEASNNFIALTEVAENWQEIASVNWHASASLVAQKHPFGLFIDIGSTTTDMVALAAGKPFCCGFSDAGRMQSQELVYSGVIRTPLMAVAQTILFEGKETGVAAEYFATTADVYRLTEELLPEEDMADTADGKDKSALASARRIARMIGHDVDDASMKDWQALALAFKEKQMDIIYRAALQHLIRLVEAHPTLTSIQIVGAGAGRFLVKQLCARLQAHARLQAIEIKYKESEERMLFTQPHTYSKTHSAIDDESQPATLNHWASVCLPAVAVAQLAFQAQLH